MSPSTNTAAQECHATCTDYSCVRAKHCMGFAGQKKESSKHPDCEDRCQLREHKGYITCNLSGQCAFAEGE